MEFIVEMIGHTPQWLRGQINDRILVIATVQGSDNPNEYVVITVFPFVQTVRRKLSELPVTILSEREVQQWIE